jgi:hypothetical protein
VKYTIKLYWSDGHSENAKVSLGQALDFIMAEYSMIGKMSDYPEDVYITKIAIDVVGE